MYLVLLSLIVLVYLKSGASLFDVSTFLSVKGIGPWLGLSILFTAGNANRFKIVLKVILVLGIVLAIGGVLNAVKLGLGFERVDAISSLRIISVSLMWISFITIAFFFKKYKKIVITLFIISFSLSLIIVTRSLLLLHSLMMFFILIKFIKKKIYLWISLLVTSPITFLIYNYMPNNNVLENSIGLLNERMTEDSRTDQIAEFFKNTKATDFIFGAGTFSEWKQWGVMYGFLDNQILLTAWWAGILPITIYLTFLIIPIKKFLIKKNYQIETQALSFIILLWLLALSGISIYTSLSTSLYFYIISFVLGYLLSRKNIKRVYVKEQ